MGEKGKGWIDSNHQDYSESEKAVLEEKLKLSTAEIKQEISQEKRDILGHVNRANRNSLKTCPSINDLTNEGSVYKNDPDTKLFDARIDALQTKSGKDFSQEYKDGRKNIRAVQWLMTQACEVCKGTHQIDELLQKGIVDRKGSGLDGFAGPNFAMTLYTLINQADALQYSDPNKTLKKPSFNGGVVTEETLQYLLALSSGEVVTKQESNSQNTHSQNTNANAQPQPEVKNNEEVTKNNTPQQPKESPTFVLTYPEAENIKKYRLDQMGFPQIGNVGEKYKNHEFAGSTINAMRDVQKQGWEFTGEPDSGRDRFGIKKDGISDSTIKDYDELLNKSENNDGKPTPQELENNIKDLCKKILTKPEEVVTKLAVPVTPTNKEVTPAVDAKDAKKGTETQPAVEGEGAPEQITLPEAVAVADKKRVDWVKGKISGIITEAKNAEKPNKLNKKEIAALDAFMVNKINNQNKPISVGDIKQISEKGLVFEYTDKKPSLLLNALKKKIQDVCTQSLTKPVFTYEMKEAEPFTELDKKLEGHKAIAESIEKNNVSLLQKVEKEQKSYVENVTQYNALAITRGGLKQAIEGFTDNNRDNNEKNNKYKELFECVKNMGLTAQEMQKNLIKVAIYQGKSSELSTIPESISTVITDLKSTDSLLQNVSDKNAINTLVTQLENIKTKGVKDAENMITQLTSRADAKNTDIMEQVTNTSKTQTAVLNTIKVGLVGNMWLANMKEGDGFITPLEKTEKVAQSNITQWTETLKTKKDTQESNDKKVYDDNNNVIKSKNDTLTRAITEDQNIFTQADTKITEAWKAIAEATKKEPIDAAVVKTNQGIIDEQSKIRSEKKQRINEHYYEKQLLIQQKNHSELLKVDADINATIALLEVKEKQNTSLQNKSASLGRQIQFIEDEANKLLRSPTSYENPDDNVNTQAIKRLETQFTALKEEKDGIDKQVVVLTGEIGALKVKRDEQGKVKDVYKTASEFIGLNAQREITTARIDGLTTEKGALEKREKDLIAQKKGIDDQITLKQKAVNDIGTVSLSDKEKRTQVTTLSKEIGALTKDSNAIQMQLNHITQTITIINQELDPYTKRLESDTKEMNTAKDILAKEDTKAFNNTENCYAPVYTPEEIKYPKEKVESEQK